VQLQELRPRLWRWTVRHPEAVTSAVPESTANWGPDVGCVAFAASDALVFVDPLVPAPDEGLWNELDELVAAYGPRVTVLTTLRWHRRSRDDVAARYGASTSRARTALPGGVETFVVPLAGETMVWLPAPRALVPGDRLLGDRNGGLRLCPESWLRYLPSKISRVELALALRPLLELPVELVLVSHGEPVLERGSDALAAALAVT